MNAKHIRMLALFPLLALGAAAPAVAAAVVEVCGSEGYNWFDLA